MIHEKKNQLIETDQEMTEMTELGKKKQKLDLSAIIYTIKYTNVKRKHKYYEEGTER